VLSHGILWVGIVFHMKSSSTFSSSAFQIFNFTELESHLLIIMTTWSKNTTFKLKAKTLHYMRDLERRLLEKLFIVTCYVRDILGRDVSPTFL